MKIALFLICLICFSVFGQGNTYKGNFTGNGGPGPNPGQTGLTNIQPSGIAQSGANPLEVLYWNGSRWLPGYVTNLGGSTPQAGTNIVITTITVGTNLNPVISVSSGVLTNNYLLPVQFGSNVIINGQFTAVNTLDAVAVNADGQVSGGNFLGSGYGLSLTPLGALSPYSTNGGIVVATNGQFLVVPYSISPSTPAVLAWGISQFSNGMALVNTPFAQETNTTIFAYHSLDQSTSIVDFTNVVPGQSLTFRSQNKNDTNYVHWEILKGGQIQVGPGGPTVTYTLLGTNGAHGTIAPGVGTVVTGGNAGFEATPANGYVVNQWLSNGVVVATGGNAYSLTSVTANTTVGVTFSSQTYTITSTEGANGTVTPLGAQTVLAGNNIIFTASPAGGYVANWSSNSVPVQTGGSTYPWNNVQASGTLAVTFSAIGPTNITAGLIAWYKLNENGGSIANNSGSLGATANLTLTGGGNAGANYWTNGYYSMFGSLFESALPPFEQGALTPIPFTYTAWIMPTNAGTVMAVIGGSGTGYPQFALDSQYPAHLTLRPSGTNITLAASTGTVSEAGIWTHVAVTYDATGDWAFYINGAVSGIGTVNPVFAFYNNSQTEIGSSYDWQNAYLYGGIKLVDIFNRVLSAGEIQNLYNLGTQ